MALRRDLLTGLRLTETACIRHIPDRVSRRASPVKLASRINIRLPAARADSRQPKGASPSSGWEAPCHASPPARSKAPLLSRLIENASPLRQCEKDGVSVPLVGVRGPDAGKGTLSPLHDRHRHGPCGSGVTNNFDP